MIKTRLLKCPGPEDDRLLCYPFESITQVHIKPYPCMQVALLLIVVTNIIVWPQMQPRLALLSFVSFAIIILTVAMGILIGDGSVSIGEVSLYLFLDSYFTVTFHPLTLVPLVRAKITSPRCHLCRFMSTFWDPSLSYSMSFISLFSWSLYTGVAYGSFKTYTTLKKGYSL